ncbi:MAG: AMP-binding protein, partial [Hyphomicrobiales bacterium]|nr:AMP-binding protein [Hyphomicrobiales bacterium]
MDISYFLRQPFGQAPRFDPQDAAIGFETETPLSYAEVAQRSLRYANALRDLGVKPGDRVGILLYNRVEYWLAYFAITRLGAIAVRLNFRLGTEELVYALTDSGSDVLLAELDQLSKLESARERIPVRCYLGFTSVENSVDVLPDWAINASILENGAAGEPDLPLPKSETPDRLMYTSGTTGRPKGALWAHSATTWWAAMQAMEWGLSRASVTMITGPMYHIG